MINILYVLPSLRFGTGITSFALNYFRRIDCSQIHIDFLVISEIIDMDLRTEIEDRGAIVYSLPIREKKGIIRRWMLVKKFFIEYGAKYSIIHSHVFLLDGILFHYAKKYGNMICISHAHATNWSDYMLRAIRNRIMALMVPYCADVWVACSKSAGEFLFGKGFSQSSKSWIVHNAIDVHKFVYDYETRMRIRKEFGYSQEIVLGNVGALQPVKNQEFLLRVFHALLQRGKREYRLLIVGDGILRDKLIKMAEGLRIKDYVTFPGVRFDIPQILQAMDIFLFPSLHEGLGIAGVEAQAAGLPCIFSNKVPKEISFGKVKYLPVKNGEDIWINEIENMELERCNAMNEIVVAGYDIEQAATILGHKYLEL